MTAGWFWARAGANVLADKGQIGAITRAVNGRAMMHAKERKERFLANLEALTA